MTELWSSFARTGVPAAAGVPEWQPYTRQNGYTMILDNMSYLTQHHDKALMQSMEPDDPLWKD
jgi:para-nitrobenzyl esterase